MERPDHVLVVDDDAEIRKLLGEYLQRNGFRVSLATDGREMRRALETRRPDIVVLDLMLPGESGLTLCRDLCAGSSLPVIMLTARAEEVDRIVGLEMGADDYLAKPFSPRELLARIKGILRRTRGLPPLRSNAHRLSFAGWTLDLAARQLIAPDGVVVALSGAEFRLLTVFVEHPNRVLDRNQLMDLTVGRDGRGRLLGAISHDLKTPITRLRLRAEMLSDPEMRTKMLRDLDEMQTMVGATLDFFASVGNDAQRQPVDVGALIESVCEDRRESGQALSVRGAPIGPYRADPQALRRCLENLIENAVRYGASADIEIHDSAERLRIAIHDRGPGIPEAELERVFEPFYRLDSSRNMDSGGTGLGLSISRSSARWHGGEVTLSNAARGGGLVAELALPR